MNKYERYINRAKSNHGDKFRDSRLNRNFIHAFNEGDSYRVLVDFGYDDKPVWGYIGATTGWKPCFLLLRRRGQHGSSETIDENCKIIKTKYI